MAVVRTVVWVVLLMLLLGFSYFNWTTIEVKIWDNLVLETKIPALVVVSFLLGLVPMWLIHRGSKWRQGRRIANLENTVRANVVTSPAVGETSVAATDTPIPPREPPLA